MLPRQSLEVRPKTLSLPLSRREIGSSAETCHDSMSKYEETGLVNKAMFTKKNSFSSVHYFQESRHTFSERPNAVCIRTLA